MSADRGSDPSFVEMLISDPDLRLNPTVEWSPHAKDRWGERAGAVGYPARGPKARKSITPRPTRRRAAGTTDPPTQS